MPAHGCSDPSLQVALPCFLPTTPQILYCRDTPTYVFFVSYFALFGSASTLYAWIGG